jgi:hypothetical protein
LLIVCGPKLNSIQLRKNCGFQSRRGLTTNLEKFF